MAFVANLGSIAADITPIETIEATSPYSFQALEDSGSGVFFVNRDIPDLYRGQYFIEEPSDLVGMAPGTQLTSSTIPMAQEAVSTFVDIFKKYPYIDQVTSLHGISGKCAEANNTPYPCVAIQFSLPPFSIVTGFFTGDTDGFVYIPFALTNSRL